MAGLSNFECIKSSTQILLELSSIHLHTHMFDRNYKFPRESGLDTHFKYLVLHNNDLKRQSFVSFWDLAGVANGVVK